MTTLTLATSDAESRGSLRFRSAGDVVEPHAVGAYKVRRLREMPARSARGRCWGRMRITVVTVTNDWPPFADEAIASVEHDGAYELEHIVVSDGAPAFAEALAAR